MTAAARFLFPVLTLVVVAFSAKVAFDASPVLVGLTKDGGVDSSANESIVVDALADAEALMQSAHADASNELPLKDLVPAGTEDASAGLLNGARPKSVRFGVVLVQFAGAQGSSTTRSREAALRLAMTLADEAKLKFHDAVSKGDSGSADDAGKIPRGVLEPAAEDVLFSLPVGEVSPPVETPRGYWIVKRLE